GVGKNMVTSIKYWMRAFGMFNEDESGPSALAEKIFNNETGWDPYLEDEGTLWLMHYQLVKWHYASIYHIIFNQLRKRRPEFNLSHFETWVSENGGNAAINTLKTDLQIFSRIYLPRDDTKDLDETYSGLLTELALVTKLTKENTEKGEKS